MLRTTHHFLSIPAEVPDSVSVDFHVVWDVDGKSWNISDLVIDSADPEVYTREQLRDILMDHISIHDINPIGDNDETPCGAD